MNPAAAATASDSAPSAAAAALAQRYGLVGRKALVTGGSRGIGRAIAEQLCSAGASVYLCALRGGELEDTVRELQGRGFDVQVRGLPPGGTVPAPAPARDLLVRSHWWKYRQ